MPVLDSSCFLGLPQGERREQLYLALGGTDDGCFLGLTLIDQYREMLDLIGSEACIFTVDDFWAAWLTFIDPDACTGMPEDQLQQAVYALLYAEAADPSLVPPDCFLGYSPEQRDMLIEIIIGAEPGPEPDPFVPDDIQPMLLWNEGDSIEGVPDQDPLATWDDDSGNGWTMTSVTGQDPTYDNDVFNGIPAPNFFGNQVMANIDFDGISGASEFTVVTVFQCLNADDLSGNSVSITNGAPDGYILQVASSELYVFGGPASAKVPYLNLSPSVAVVRYNGAATGNANRLKLDLNGDPQTITFTGTVPAVHPSGNGIAYGRYYSLNVAYWEGPIYANLVYGRALTDDEVDQIQEFYIRKCGIAEIVTGTSGGLAYQIAIPRNANGRGVVLFHGSGLTETAMYSPYVREATVAFLAEGYTVIGSIGQPSGQGWGNNGEQANYAAVIAVARADHGVGDVLFWAMSMGGLSSLLLLSAGTVSGVTGWLGTYPVCNLDNMHDNPTYTATIDAAYGGDYPGNSVGHDPVLLTGSTLNGFQSLPMKAWASSEDTVVPRSENIDLFKTVVASKTTIEIINATGEHGDLSHINPTAYVEFANLCFSL